MAGAVRPLGELRAVPDALIHRRELPSRGSLRPEIEKPWLRCVASGVNPESLAPRYSLSGRVPGRGP
jgi:hypothetical protein